MADAEESPSSLAELEALAGLESPGANTSDESSTEPDARDFDLASLAASTAVGATVRDELTDEATLALSALVSPLSADAAVSGGMAVADPAASNTAKVQPNVAAPHAATAPGFASGLLAGVAIAGLLAVVAVVVMLRAPAASSPSAPAPPPATVSAAVPLADRAGSDAERARVTDVPPVAPTSDTSSVTPATPATTLARSNAKASGVTRSASANTASEPPATLASAASSPQADPTRPPDAPAPVASASEATARPIDTLLDDALGSRKPTKQAKPTSDGLMGDELPLTPTAADVTQVVQVLLPAIRGCAMGQSGVANTLLVVRGDGGVASASITGAPFAGVASGRCMEGVLRRAKFPRFRQSVFRVQFPLSIRGGA